MHTKNSCDCWPVIRADPQRHVPSPTPWCSLPCSLSGDGSPAPAPIGSLNLGRSGPDGRALVPQSRCPQLAALCRRLKPAPMPLHVRLLPVRDPHSSYPPLVSMKEWLLDSPVNWMHNLACQRRERSIPGEREARVSASRLAKAFYDKCGLILTQPVGSRVRLGSIGYLEDDQWTEVSTTRSKFGLVLNELPGIRQANSFSVSSGRDFKF